MQQQWIWQQPDWPNFNYDLSAVLPHLERSIQQVAPLKHLATAITAEQRLDWEAAILLDETLASADIEGEVYNADSVRSSIANYLGLTTSNDSTQLKFDKNADAMVELLLRGIHRVDQTMTPEVLKDWHQQLFPTPSILNPVTAGQYRNDTMQIISGRYGKQTIHFIAPGESQQQVENQMIQFFSWLNQTQPESGYIRAAIAKFWFVTIHPFDDGNGRLSRMLAERCLAEAEHTNLRLYSLSTVFSSGRDLYYQQLEKQQRNSTDLTQWIIYFLNTVEQAANNAQQVFQQVMQRTKFWQQHQQNTFNPRQYKLIKRLLTTNDFKDGISRKKYKSMTKTTDATAVRDLNDLVDKNVLSPVGEGRGRKYQLARLK